MPDSVRIDQWLWAARFFKSRSLCRKAVDAGHVQLAGVRVKPSRPVKVDDTIIVKQGAARREVKVLALATRRGSAAVAATLYDETAESIQRREHEAEQRKLASQARVAPDRRPDKRSRRRLAKLKTDFDTH